MGVHGTERGGGWTEREGGREEGVGGGEDWTSAQLLLN